MAEKIYKIAVKEDLFIHNLQLSGQRQEELDVMVWVYNVNQILKL